MEQRTVPTLAQETWLSCSVHEVILSFLRSEWAKWPMISAYWDHNLVAQGSDFVDATENNVRAQMLWAIRSPLLQTIPSDTRWFRVQHLRGNHFAELHTINHVAWNAPEDMNELGKVALRTMQVCKAPEGQWSPILWAHDKNGPFTILEGNHRMTALAQSANKRSVELIAYVGLSRNRCIWHLLDGVT
jgi:hypothetical protein